MKVILLPLALVAVGACAQTASVITGVQNSPTTTTTIPLNIPTQYAFTTVPTPTATTKHYVSFSKGNDALDGLTPATAWKTVAKVNAYACGGGDAIYFNAEDTWHEQLTVNCSGASLANPVFFGAYGIAGLKPTFDPADVVTGWTVQSGNTYQATYANTVVKGFVDSLTAQTVPLALQTSIANVNSTAGSIYSDGTNVYVHLLDNTSPATHVIEVSSTARRYGILMADRNYVIINGIRVIRSAGAAIVGILNADNSTNQFNAYNTFQGNETYNCDSTQLDNALFTGGCIVVRGRDNSTAAGILGWNIVGNKVGRLDKEAAINDDKGAIQVTGTIGAVIQDNDINPTNGMAIQTRKYFSGTQSSRNLISYNRITNSEGGIRAAGPGTALAFGTGDYVLGNTILHSRGFGAQVGGGGSIVGNTMFDLAKSTDGTLYNGIDLNQQPNVLVRDNRVSQVWACSLTLEQASQGAVVINNVFDATMNTGNTNTPGEQNCALFEMSGSTPGLIMSGNQWITTPAHPIDSVFNVPNYSGNAGFYVTAATLAGTNTPTMAPGSAAGTSPTCTTVTGTYNSHVISCTTGTATATGVLATITFNAALGTAPSSCQITPRNAAAAPTMTSVYAGTPSVTSYTLSVATALAVSTSYQYQVLCQ